MTDDEVSLIEEVVSQGVVRTGVGLIAAGALLSTVGVAVCCSAAVAELRRRLTFAATPVGGPVAWPGRATATADVAIGDAARHVPPQRLSTGPPEVRTTSGQGGRRG